MILLIEMKQMPVKWIPTPFLLAKHPVYPQYTDTHTFHLISYCWITYLGNKLICINCLVFDSRVESIKKLHYT